MQSWLRWQVPLARVDVARPVLQRLAAEHEAQELPSLVLYRKGGRWSRFDGPQTAPAIVEFVRKSVVKKPLVPLRSVADVEAFLNRDVTRLGLGAGPIPEYATMVVGFFADPEVEEDELQEYAEAARELQGREDVYTGVVKGHEAAVCKHYKALKAGGIDRTPALLAKRADMLQGVSVNLDELYGEGMSVARWVFQATLPLVGEISGRNFKSYEELGLPMLILFLNLSQRDLEEEERRRAGAEGAVVAVDSSLAVPGQTGELPNARLLEEFRVVAADHVSSSSGPRVIDRLTMPVGEVLTLLAPVHAWWCVWVGGW